MGLFECFSQFHSVVQSCPNLCDPMDCSTPGLVSNTDSRSSLKFMSIKSVMPFSHLSLYYLLLLLPSIFPSIRFFWNESDFRIRGPKYWSFILCISLSNEYSGLILGWTSWISLQSKGLSRIYSNTTVQKYQLLGAQLYSPTHTSIYDYWQNYSFY